MRIAVIGSWHNAMVTSACLSGLGHEVTLVNDELRGGWSEFPRLELEVKEPGLTELVGSSSFTMVEHWKRSNPDNLWANLSRSAAPSAIAPGEKSLDVDLLWLASDTPLSASGHPDVKPLWGIVSKMRSRWPFMDLYVVSSQVPVGFCRSVTESTRVPVAYVPENMRVGRAVNDFLKPDRLVIGATSPWTRAAVASLLAEIHPKPILCSLETAEMVKHATNAFLATSISFANEIARIGAPYGVDSAVVAEALRADSRIGPKAYVRAGEGFGNGTLERDLRALQSLGATGPSDLSHLRTPLVDAVLEVNEKQRKPAPTAHELHLKGK